MRSILLRKYPNSTISTFNVVETFIPHYREEIQAIETKLPQYVPREIAKQLLDNLSTAKSAKLNCKNFHLINQKQVDSLSDAYRDTDGTKEFKKYTSYYFTEPVFAGDFAIVKVRDYRGSMISTDFTYLCKKRENTFVIYQILWSSAS